ncbi:MAG: 6-phosphogluconolactonase [Acidimicrobiales bacterium]
MSDDLHRLVIEPAEMWAAVAADRLARAITASVEERGRCLLALSGGTTPGPVFVDLARRDLAWDRVVLLQADERLAPAGSAERNLTMQRAAFEHLPVTWLPLPVDELVDPAGPDELPPVEVVADSLAAFGARLRALADDPPIIDIAQLGLGRDGHTASLLPGDPGIAELRRPLALTGSYEGRRRLTMTRPVFDRTRAVVWLVAGQDKAEALGRLLVGDLTIPAGLIRPRSSLVIADDAAARQV